MKKWLMSLFSILLVFGLITGCSDADEEEGPVEDPEMQEDKTGNEENINEGDGTIDQEDDDTMNKDGSEEGDKDEDGNMDEGEIDNNEKQPNDEAKDQN
ncbi:MAG: hypothetical protein WCF60_02205 [Anaerobacillus sp.]